MTNNPIPLPDVERVGNEWHFADGTVLAVVSGGADEGGGDAGGDAAPPAPAVEAAPAQTAPVGSTPAATPAAPEASVLDTELGDDQVYSRGYVEKLRKEAERYRSESQGNAEQLATYNEVYGQYEADDRDAWFSMAQEWARDPRAGAEMMKRISDAVLNDGVTPEEATQQVIAEDQVAAEVAQAGVNLTPEQVQALVDERFAAQDQERAQNNAVEEVFTELRAAGFDPQTREGHSVLWTANHETNGDIAKAIEIVKADRQAIIDDYVSGKSAPTARVAPSDGVLANQAPVMNNLDDAFKAANAFMKGQQSQAG
jgi:hypothetical protein